MSFARPTSLSGQAWSVELDVKALGAQRLSVASEASADRLAAGSTIHLALAKFTPKHCTFLARRRNHLLAAETCPLRLYLSVGNLAPRGRASP
jgi:hypothetical protein